MTIVALDVVFVKNFVLEGVLRYLEIDSVLPDIHFPHLRNLMDVTHVGAVFGCAHTWPWRSINALKHKIYLQLVCFNSPWKT